MAQRERSGQGLEVLRAGLHGMGIAINNEAIQLQLDDSPRSADLEAESRRREFEDGLDYLREIAALLT